MTIPTQNNEVDLENPLHRAVHKLNTLLAMDPQAFSELIDKRVPVTDELADHPDIIVAEEGLGPLGLLNTMLSGMGLPTVVACYEEDGTLIGFRPKDTLAGS